MTGRAYFFTWFGLLFLTLLSFGLSYAPLGVLEMPAALFIALLKGLLVAMVFMQLALQRFTYRFILLLGVLFMLLLVVLTALDVLTRGAQIYT
nr:caa3_sub_IV: caa(3)-type oxidase, subunit [uncultured bacterium]